MQISLISHEKSFKTLFLGIAKVVTLLYLCIIFVSL